MQVTQSQLKSFARMCNKFGLQIRTNEHGAYLAHKDLGAGVIPCVVEDKFTKTLHFNPTGQGEKPRDKALALINKLPEAGTIDFPSANWEDKLPIKRIDYTIY